MDAFAHNAPTRSAALESDHRRNEILEIAKTLFKQKGYKATTMAEIASGANLAVGTVYKFFKDKHDLYSTLVAETMAEFESAAIQALRDTPGDETARIQRYLLRGAELFAKHLPLIRVYFSETGAAFLYAAAGLENEASVAYEHIVTELTEVFRSGIERGLFIDLPPEALRRGLEGIHNAFMSVLIRDPERYTPEQIAALCGRIFFDSVRRG